MNPEDKLQLLQAIEEKQAAHRRRADWLAWGSVLLAAFVLAAMIAAGGRELAKIERKVATASTELARMQETLAAKQAELAAKQAELARTEERLREVQGVLGGLQYGDLDRLVARRLVEKPEAAKQLPRIYLQIVDEEDRAFASSMAETLREAGYLVLGVELREDAARLRRTDVRHYKQAERPEAERIAEVLRAAGAADVTVSYLRGYENSRAVRPNHFEVWFRRRPSAT